MALGKIAAAKQREGFEWWETSIGYYLFLIQLTHNPENGYKPQSASLPFI